MKIFYFTHAKGGVGTSLLATNFAYGLAKQFKNKKILFLDTNQLSDIAPLFGINPKKDIFNLEMFLDDFSSEKIPIKTLTDVFNKNVYQIKELDVLLSPQNYYTLNDLNTVYKKILVQATKIYDYVIIDAERENNYLLQEILSQLHSVILTTNLDNLAVVKTASLLNTLDEIIDLEKIKIICNQSENFKKKDLNNLFLAPIIATLPTEINGAWDNVLLGVPIIENRKLSYSKEINKLVQKLLRSELKK
jgi:cellulose biosynthesis protein BcsQ